MEKEKIMALSNIAPFQQKSLTFGDNPLLRGWDDMHREMDRVFDNFFSDALPRVPFGMLPTMMPSTLDLDVAETDKAYLITAELPGLEDKDIDLTLSDGILTLKGEKKQEEETEGKTFHRIERRYGSFQRVLQLPGDADDKAVKATMKNGVLQIEIGKNEKAKLSSKKIAIKAN